MYWWQFEPDQYRAAFSAFSLAMMRPTSGPSGSRMFFIFMASSRLVIFGPSWSRGSAIGSEKAIVKSRSLKLVNAGTHTTILAFGGAEHQAST